MNKIILTGVRDLATDQKIEPQTDYAVILTAQRISEEFEDQDSDDEQVVKYRLKVSHIEQIYNLKSSEEVKVKEKKFTLSQQMRFGVERRVQEYEGFMKWALANLDKLCDEYLETLKNE